MYDFLVIIIASILIFIIFRTVTILVGLIRSNFDTNLIYEQDAWVEEMNRKQLEEWRKEQALKKRDPNPKNDFDDDVAF